MCLWGLVWPQWSISESRWRRLHASYWELRNVHWNLETKWFLTKGLPVLETWETADPILSNYRRMKVFSLQAIKLEVMKIFSYKSIRFNPVPTRLCHVIYYNSNKKYPSLASGNRVNWVNANTNTMTKVKLKSTMFTLENILFSSKSKQLRNFFVWTKLD